MKSKYTLGTRGSLLALTQSKILLKELSEKTGLDFEIKTIKTQGDLVTDKPLWQIDGKDFFTKELDRALLAGEVDFVIHSYKNLGSDRPEGIKLAAIPPRLFPNDVLLFKKQSLTEDKKVYLIGTSSPRRIVNIEDSLIDFLPIPSSSKIKCENLRGNVNTRIEKLKNTNLDGIVLAMAGLERLARREDSKKTLISLLKDLNLSILPQSIFPSSSSQGALGVEYCPKHNPELKEVFNKVHCQETADLVGMERKSFSKYGGGCHLAIGIHVKKTNIGLVEIHKGFHNNVSINKRILVEGPLNRDLKPLEESSKVFLGLPETNETYSNTLYDQALKKTNYPLADQLSGDLIVTSKYCMSSLDNKENQVSIWSSGIFTWKRLVKQGFWVTGSADSFGLEEIYQFEKSELLKIHLDRSPQWNILTAKGVKYSKKHTAVYQRQMENLSLEEEKELKQAEAFYWTSFYQYQEYSKKLPSIRNKKHFCGIGKTFNQFNENSIEVTPVINMQELKDCLRKRK